MVWPVTENLYGRFSRMTNEELFSKAVSGDWLAEKFERPSVSDGVGKFLLKGTSKGFAAFSDAIKDGQVVFFSAFDDACNREAGFAVYNASEKSLTPVESNSALANGKYLSGDVRPISFPEGGTICATFNAEAFNTVWEHVHNRQNPHEVTADQIPQDNYNGLGDDVQTALDTLGKAISTINPDEIPDWQDVVRDDIEGNTDLLQRPLNRFIHEDGHGEWIVDEGGVPPGTVIGDVPMWKGREYIPVKLITDNILDVQSESAKRDDFLIFNGSGKWVAESFHMDTTLHFMGSWDFTTDPPANPKAGDLYINTTEGKMSAGWGPLADTEVHAGNMVGYSGSKGRWYLLGDVASSAVIQVVEGDCIVVDETQPDRPVVGLTKACQADIALGVEAHGWGDHAQDIIDLNDKIDNLGQNGGQALKELEQKVDDNKLEFDNHTHKMDDLTDVNATSPTQDDLLIWNGVNWVSDSFDFIQTAMRFKGAIAPTASAPSAPENGDLYVFDTAGTIDSSWGPISGQAVQPGKFVGYSSANGRWYLLGDMSDVGVTEVSPGLCIDVDATAPAKPVVSVDEVTRNKIDDAYGWGDHSADITDLEGKIEELSKLEGSDVTNLQGQINDLKNDLNNHEHAMDDLSDVNADPAGNKRDDLLIWNGVSQWVSTDFKFIQTALRFKGGIAPTAAAPTNPEGGDLYVFESDGTVSASWGAIAGRVVQAGKFVGYAAGSNNRWFLLGDMADVGVMKVVKGAGILVDDSKPSEPVVSVEFGTTSSTVARGDHTHSEYLTSSDVNLDWVHTNEDQKNIGLGWNVNFGTSNTEEVLIGNNVNGGGAAVAIGGGAEAAVLSVALGYGAVAGEEAVAIGQDAFANNFEFAISPIIRSVNFTRQTVQAKDYLDADGNSIIGAGGDVDLSNYYTKTESDGKYEPKFAKNSAFNKDFGTTSTTVSRGDHAHSQYLTSSNLTGYATEAWVTSGFQPKGNYALVGDSYTKAESDAKYELKGGGGLPDGDWHCTGSITAAGNITAYSTSDERLKDDITAMPVGLIDGISPVTWKWKEGGKKSGGVVAQQLEQCGLGNWVHEAPDGTLGVDYNALIGVLLAEVKSLKDRVKELEK